MPFEEQNGDEVVDAEETKQPSAALAEVQEPLPLVPDQGEDEGDVDDLAESFSASIGSKDWTVETLVSQMRKGRIDLDPTFQRRNAWLRNRKSKLIESIMLGFPIPQIVLAESSDAPGHYFVLDGKQRLLALRQFFVDKDDPRDADFEQLRLIGLEVLTGINRMTAQDVEASRPDLIATMENHSIRTVVLSQWNSERLLLSLFLRLNTGSVMLSPQELRQALIHGEFMQWLDAVSGDMEPLRKLLGNTAPDRRMVDAELTLRHLAFGSSPIPYQGNLKQFLDATSKLYNGDWGTWRAEVERSTAEMAKALEAGFEIFGVDKLCRKWSGERFERPLNRALFDVQIYSLSLPDVRAKIIDNATEVVERFKVECERDVSFVQSISATTKTRDAFMTRHRAWADIVKQAASAGYPLPACLDSI